MKEYPIHHVINGVEYIEEKPPPFWANRYSQEEADKWPKSKPIPRYIENPEKPNWSMINPDWENAPYEEVILNSTEPLKLKLK